MEAAPIANPVAQPPAFDPQAAIAQLQQSGYHVYNKDAKFDRQQAEADPFLKTVVAPAIAERFSEVYLKLDQDILESTGIAKNPGEKTYEYQRRAAAQLKEQIQKAPDVEAIKQDYEKRLSAADQRMAEVSLRSALGGLKLNVEDSAVESQRELLLMRALSMPHRVEGTDIVFQKYASDGTTLIDDIDPTTGKAKTAAKFLEEQFKPFLKVEQPAPQGPGKHPKPADTNSPAPKTKQDLITLLGNEGVQMGGPDFMAKLKAKATEYAISITE